MYYKLEDNEEVEITYSQALYELEFGSCSIDYGPYYLLNIHKIKTDEPEQDWKHSPPTCLNGLYEVCFNRFNRIAYCLCTTPQQAFNMARLIHDGMIPKKDGLEWN